MKYFHAILLLVIVGYLDSNAALSFPKQMQTTNEKLSTRRRFFFQSFTLIVTLPLLQPTSCAFAETSPTSTSGVDNKTTNEQDEIHQRLLERRKLMQASRSSNKRQSYLDLSKQRAAMYNTTYQGANCPTNVPCL